MARHLGGHVPRELADGQGRRRRRGGRPDDGSSGLGSPTTTLVLGSDPRPKGTKEPGAAGAAQRADSIMLLRSGGGASAKLSIPRDTLVTIPGHGV